jgi:uncharacterized protein YbjT (DUF2867 family)
VKTVFVAGATGAVGSVLVPYLKESHFSVIPHVRPQTAERHPLGKDPRALVAELADTPRLDEQMARVHAVVCLVGTMRNRFRAGDTYESSDYRPVVQLLDSAKRAPLAEPRHFILLSALGARSGSGYLGWKFKAEEAVRSSGLPATILRPSFLDTRGSRSRPSHGTERRPPPVLGAALELMGKVPALRGVADDLRPTADYVAGAFDGLTARDPLNRVLEAEFRTILPDQVLAFVDRLSMAHSLEVRTAYLDTAVVEYVAGLPGRLKIRDGETKHLLKRAALRYFPAEMVHRRKEGFVMPVTDWLLSDLEEYVRDTLSPAALARHGLLDPAAVARLVDGFYQSTGDYAYGNKILALVVFQEWYSIYMDGNGWA